MTITKHTPVVIDPNFTRHLMLLNDFRNKFMEIMMSQRVDDFIGGVSVKKFDIDPIVGIETTLRVEKYAPLLRINPDVWVGLIETMVSELFERLSRGDEIISKGVVYAGIPISLFVKKNKGLYIIPSFGYFFIDDDIENIFSPGDIPIFGFVLYDSLFNIDLNKTSGCVLLSVLNENEKPPILSSEILNYYLNIFGKSNKIHQAFDFFNNKIKTE